MTPANIKRSGTLQRLINETTDEDRQRWKDERVERKKNTTLTYQLGHYVGAEIFNCYLPTLSSDMLHSRKVIEISEEDSKENKRLESEWYSTTKYGSNRDLEKCKENWDLYYAHNKMLEKKYLPDPLECHLDILNVEDWEEFKKGLIDYLWNCDMCSYSLKPEDIEITETEDVYFTIIKFKLCQQDIPQES
jgi:hypothetical protein